MKRGTKKFASTVRLPDEIIAEILSRVPVKALLRCKCVCKRWKDLLSDPYFVLSPTGREKAIVGFLPFRRKKSIDSRRMYFCSIDDKFSVEELRDPVGEMPSDYSSFSLLGTCNGLILFSTKQEMYLWNPLTGCCRILSQFRGLNPFHFQASGVCFDKVSDDYKAVLMIEDWGRVLHNSVYVASLRTGDLSLLDNNFPYSASDRQVPYVSSTSGVLVSNHLHWIMQKGFCMLQLIVCFNVEKNQFTELPMPDEHEFGDMVSANYCGLATLYGCLCMSKYGGSSIEDDMDVLIMREYGGKHSWTKLFTIRGILVPFQTGIPSNIILVLKRNGSLYTYNIEKKCFKRIKCPPSDRLRKIRDNLRSESGAEIPHVMKRIAGPSMFIESLTSVQQL